MPTLMTNPPLHKTHSNTHQPVAGSTSHHNHRNSHVNDSRPRGHHNSGRKPPEREHTRPPPPRRRKGWCQSCLPTRRSNPNANNPSNSSGSASRHHRPHAAPAGSLRVKDLQISNPIPIEGGGVGPRGGRRPGNLVPIVPYREHPAPAPAPAPVHIPLSSSSPDYSDLSSERSRTASEARTPVSDLSDTDITSVGGTSSEEDSQSSLSFSASSSTGYTSTSTGYSTSYLGGSSSMSSSLHMHRLSMNMDSRLSEVGMVPGAGEGISKQRERQLRAAVANLEAAAAVSSHGDTQTKQVRRDPVRTSIQSTQSTHIPLHMAHPGNRQSAVVQFSDPSYSMSGGGGPSSSGAPLSRSLSNSQQQRRSRVIPRELSEIPPPQSEDIITELVPPPHSHSHRVNVPPPAPTPPPSSPSEFGLSSSYAETGTTPEPSSSGGAPQRILIDRSSDENSGLGESSGGTADGTDAGQGRGKKHTFRNLLLLPPLVTVLVADKAWRRVRGKRGPRPMGEVPGVWKVLGLAPG